MAWTQIATAQDNGQSSEVDWQGGKGNFAAKGTFDSATVKLQFSPDDGTTWIDVGTNTELTAAGGAVFELADCKLRVDVSGAVTAAAIDAYAQQLPTKVEGRFA